MKIFRYEKVICLWFFNFKEVVVFVCDLSGKDDFVSGWCDRCFCIWGWVGSDIDMMYVWCVFGCFFLYIINISCVGVEWCVWCFV